MILTLPPDHPILNPREGWTDHEGHEFLSAVEVTPGQPIDVVTQIPDEHECYGCDRCYVEGRADEWIGTEPVYLGGQYQQMLYLAAIVGTVTALTTELVDWVTDDDHNPIRWRVTVSGLTPCDPTTERPCPWLRYDWHDPAPDVTCTACNDTGSLPVVAGTELRIEP